MVVVLIIEAAEAATSHSHCTSRSHSRGETKRASHTDRVKEIEKCNKNKFQPTKQKLKNQNKTKATEIFDCNKSFVRAPQRCNTQLRKKKKKQAKSGSETFLVQITRCSGSGSRRQPQPQPRST